MNVIGVSALYHNSACCLIQDGVLVAAVEEERFTRIKADPDMPQEALRYCLEAGGISIHDVDAMAYYEDPAKKLDRQLWSGVGRTMPNWQSYLDVNRPEEVMRILLGYEGPIMFFDHHLSHAASSYYFSGFEEAALLTVDGVGEWATTTYGSGQGKTLSLFEEVHFPDSLGLLYSTITSYLGFGVNDGEYKVMGLAPYGKPRYTDKLWQLIKMGPGGQYQLNMEYFDFLEGNRMYSDALIDLLQLPVRPADAEMTQVHADLAVSLQVVLESVLLSKATYLHGRTGSSNLCMAGGVALNCVANGNILRKGPFKKMFVQPAANDAGGALGAAALAQVALTGEAPVREPLRHVYLGPRFGRSEIDRMLQSTSIVYENYRNNTDQLMAETARRLADGKVIGWFSGHMEFGPRSLGGRSILADPRSPQMRDLINAMVKKREGFRPFAPAVLESEAHHHFDLDHPSPFMLETCQVISPLDLPAITHVDGSARVQTVTADTNPRFAALLEAFNALTGCPILLNTSFNVKGEPIVCTPEDALKCFIANDIDCLVMEDYLIDRDENSLDILKWLLSTEQHLSTVSQNVYTFI